MKTLMKKLIPMLLAVITVCSLIPMSAVAAEDSLVVIDDALKTEESLRLFEVFGGTGAALRKIDGQAVGVYVEGATAGMGYPYLLVGEDDWEDYTIEFTAHNMDRVGAIVRSKDAVNHIDGCNGIVAMYEGKSNKYVAQDKWGLNAHFSIVNQTTNAGSIEVVANGDKTEDYFVCNEDFSGSMKFKVTIRGDRLTAEITYTEGGTPVTKNIDVITNKYDKPAGKVGLRAVYVQHNGTKSAGYFSDLKVTLLGDTATKYKAENPNWDNPNATPPETTAPETTAPETNAPETNAPETNAPTTNAPTTNKPSTTNAPTTNAPTTNAPAADADDADAENNNTLIIVIACVVAAGVIALVVVLVVKKKKSN